MQPNIARGDLQGRHKRTAWSLPVFAFLSCMALVMVPVVDVWHRFLDRHPAEVMVVVIQAELAAKSSFR